MRDRWHVTSIRLEKSLGETLARLASKFDVSFSEAVAQVLKFGLTNRNWDTLGFGFSRPQRPNNPSEGLMAKKSAADYPIAKVARKNPAKPKIEKRAVAANPEFRYLVRETLREGGYHYVAGFVYSDDAIKFARAYAKTVSVPVAVDDQFA